MTNKMDPILKANWCKALRSGEYVQGQGTLRNDAGQYCCLGVLCVVAGLELDPSGNSPVGSKDSYQPIEPLVGDASLNALYHRNDGICGQRPHTFSEIADYIESPESGL
jgi:hypothetical protein